MYIALAYIYDMWQHIAFMSNMCSKVMITGDYLKTAIAIAKNVQILQPQDDEAPEVDPRDIYIYYIHIYILYFTNTRYILVDISDLYTCVGECCTFRSFKYALPILAWLHVCQGCRCEPLDL